jgi:hypothetical protein
MFGFADIGRGMAAVGYGLLVIGPFLPEFTPFGFRESGYEKVATIGTAGHPAIGDRRLVSAEIPGAAFFVPTVFFQR